jgi:hypothetical protein
MARPDGAMDDSVDLVRAEPCVDGSIISNIQL